MSRWKERTFVDLQDILRQFLDVYRNAVSVVGAALKPS
jgi:hypothetical protein